MWIRFYFTYSILLLVTSSHLYVFDPKTMVRGIVVQFTVSHWTVNYSGIKSWRAHISFFSHSNYYDHHSVGHLEKLGCPRHGKRGESVVFGPMCPFNKDHVLNYKGIVENGLNFLTSICLASHDNLNGRHSLLSTIHLLASILLIRPAIAEYLEKTYPNTPSVSQTKQSTPRMNLKPSLNGVSTQCGFPFFWFGAPSS